MNLDVSNWQEFILAKIVDISYGNKFDNNKMTCENPSVNFVSRTAENNGVSDFVDYIQGVTPYPAGCMTIALGGSIGTCCIQTAPFYTGQNVAVLHTTHLSNETKLFLSLIIMKETSIRYCAFGRELNKHINTDFTVRLPVVHDNNTPIIDCTYKYSANGYIPDWQFMEKYIKSLHSKPLTTTIQPGMSPKLNVIKWREFKVSNILECDSTALSIKDDLGDGTIPFISRTAENNGCDGYVNVSSDKITSGNCLTIGAEGAYSFYQPIDFATGNKVYQLRNRHMNLYVGLFLSTVLNYSVYKYSYGRARVLNKLKDEQIHLPIVCNEDGTPFIDETHEYSIEGYVPDWQFMEEYIKSLPYGDRLQ